MKEELTLSKTGPSLTLVKADGSTLTLQAPSPVALRVSNRVQLPDGFNPPVNDTETRILAATNISMYRAIEAGGVPCSLNSDSFGKYVGITLTAVSAGSYVVVRKDGIVEDNLWTWTPDLAILIGPNGTLVQSFGNPPLRRIGWAVTATQINLDPFPTIGD